MLLVAFQVNCKDISFLLVVGPKIFPPWFQFLVLCPQRVVIYLNVVVSIHIYSLYRLFLMKAIKVHMDLVSWACCVERLFSLGFALMLLCISPIHLHTWQSITS